MQHGAEVAPWSLPPASTSDGLRERLERHCDGDRRPHVLRNPSRVPGVVFEDVMTLEILLSPGLARQPGLARFQGRVRQSDFAPILETIRGEIHREFGPLGDSPRLAASP